ncbi:MAG TPA: hypothetical protein VK978_04890 [Candidatus Saccharimonadales bacterium]|nr:hypothetical protein [Candidatus Saccharimonadales bacterium]
MKQTLSARRMAENEVVFRQYNEGVQQGFDEIRQLAEESGQTYLVQADDTPLYFYCECSDENCQKRIKLKPSKYTEIHKRRNRFVIICGHETKLIEHVVGKHGGFCIVEKFQTPSEYAGGLHETEVDNSSP